MHHFWANYLRFFGDRVGVGAEYQYGFREVASGDVGEDHRFMVLLAVRSSAVKSSSVVREMNIVDTIARSASPVTGGGGLDSDLPAPAQPPEVESLFMPTPISATVDQRDLRSVIRQTQLGGSAFRQSL